MKVTYHVYKDYQFAARGGSDEEILAGRAQARKLARLRYSFVSMCWHPKRKRLFVGCTNASGDFLVEFNPATGRFRSCGYARSGIWEPTEAKIHKGLWLDEEEDALYFGTSTLKGIPETIGSAGGKLVRYRIAARVFELLGAPTPGDFYQATGYDRRRKKLYFYTMPGSRFGVFDLRKKRLERCDLMASIPHIGCIDDEGGAWGTYGSSRQAFFRYLPDAGRYEFPEGCAFPNAYAASNVMFAGAGPVDSFANGGDGFLYVGSALAELYRLDPVTKELLFLGKPFPGRRLPGIALAEDGLIYLCGGSDGASMLARYDREGGGFERLGLIRAKDGTTCFRCHELVVTGGVAYIGETDNRDRSGYLWACQL